jgi:hypothetical protein
MVTVEALIMKRATVYLRSGVIYMHASSKTTAGVWIFAPPCLRVELASTDRELGQEVARTLEGSQSGIAHPRQWGGLIEPLLQLANVKTWNAFARRASCVNVDLEASRISVVPMRNLGPDEGFLAMTGSALVVDSEQLEEVGARVRQALGA